MAWGQVAAFYDHFLAFATLKDFAWSDEHNPAAAPNRKAGSLFPPDALPRLASFCVVAVPGLRASCAPQHDQHERMKIACVWRSSWQPI